MNEVSQWRENALKALEDARADIESASEPTVVVVLTIAERDLFNERPISFYANQKPEWLHKVLAFCTWRLALKAYDKALLHPSQEEERM